MAKKISAAKSAVAPKTVKPAGVPTVEAVPSDAVKSTPARNSPVPKSEPIIASRKEITFDMIAKRAFEIHCGGTGGDEMHNWLRAERELKGL